MRFVCKLCQQLQLWLDPVRLYVCVPTPPTPLTTARVLAPVTTVTSDRVITAEGNALSRSVVLSLRNARSVERLTLSVLLWIQL